MLLKDIRLANGAKSSMALESEFWAALERIARSQSTTVRDLIRRVDGDTKRDGSQNLTSAVRVFIINHMLGNAFTSPTCDTPANIEKDSKAHGTKGYQDSRSTRG
jgi:predicted DNA-binding ribbon-helix-helix protein